MIRLTRALFNKRAKNPRTPYYITSILKPTDGDQVIWGDTHISVGFYRTRCWHRVKFRRTPVAMDMKLYSHILNRILKLKMGTAAIKCVDALGGLDQYMLRTHPGRFKSVIGVSLQKFLTKMLQERGYDVKDYNKFLYSTNYESKLEPITIYKLLNWKRRDKYTKRPKYLINKPRKIRPPYKNNYIAIP
ncbi:hypothetical protein RF11_03795 [Thelohanellus kitauei]|uniref:Large ribosomal subunit protein bL28m n=1 Tax=Thelohanellus kitauei TaxID=669202 RepID=A0A0C2IIR2_THEKT|nr:hypothetical protein RF11_03320 [Thelohanellus kitauei]KII68890.1 hypothetical protein RF11_03795 [Thelohanellus kitauei]